MYQISEKRKYVTHRDILLKMKELYPSHPDMFTITWVQNFCRNRSNMSGNGGHFMIIIEILIIYVFVKFIRRYPFGSF